MRTGCAMLALTIASVAQTGAAAPAADLDSRVVSLVGAVSEERLTALLTRLQGFETRNTLSSSDSSSRGIGAARQWIFEELSRSGGGRLQVAFDTHFVAKQGQRVTRDVELRNVMAVLPGKNPRRLYVTAHYDSLARQRPTASGGSPPASGSGLRVPGLGNQVSTAPAGFDFTRNDNFAPGANDDGSGTVLTMELARIFAASRIDFDATLVFMLFAGEEQGLVGSHLYARRAATEKHPIEAVLNNDIVGNAHAGNGIDDAESVRVFSEGPEDSPSRQLARYIARQAARYVPSHRVTLIARHDRFGRGGDHTSFNQQGYAAVRITEANENYARQHTVEDTIDGVSVAYLARNIRVNAAALASMALAPPAPRLDDEQDRSGLDRGESGYDARLRWQASPGAVGYRISWRPAWSPDWQHEISAGSATEFVLPGVSIDDHVFGVAAVGSDGHESLVSAYVNPDRPDPDIKTLPAPPSAPR